MSNTDTRHILPRYNDDNAAPNSYYMEPIQPQHQPQPTYVNNSTCVLTQPVANTVIQVISVHDHTNLAVFSCLCCFMPVGLAAVVMASLSSDALGHGDITRAQSRGRIGRLLSLISIGIGVAIIIITITTIIILAQSHSQRQNYN